MTKSEKAIHYFNSGFNCAQAVITAFGPDLGLSENDCLKVSCAFGGGIARQQYLCGAVSGALMVLGLKFGKAMGEDDSKKAYTYRKSKEFMEAFKSENASIYCKELLNGLDMNTEDGMKQIKERNLFKLKCDFFVANAAKIVEKMMNE